jgi:hypothetical protein
MMSIGNKNSVNSLATGSLDPSALEMLQPLAAATAARRMGTVASSVYVSPPT